MKIALGSRAAARAGESGRAAHDRVRSLAIGLFVLTAVLNGCAAEPVTEPVALASQALQANCGCSKTGAYVPPVLSPPAATSVTYTASAAVSTGSTTLTVRRRSDNATVFSAVAPVPTAFSPTPATFGFSPSGNAFIYRYALQGLDTLFLVDLSSGVGRTVYSRTTVTNSAAAQFSPSGRYMVDAYVNGPNGVTVNLLDTVSGALAYSATYNLFGQAGPPMNRTLNVANWGFSPDDETFVTVYVSGQNTVQWTLINAVKRSSVASTQITGSALWAFTPCGDAIGLVQVSNQGNASVTLRRTSDGATLGNASGAALPNGVKLSTTVDKQLAVINTTTFQLAPNTAGSVCPLGLSAVAVSPTSVLGGQSVKGTVTLSANAPAAGSVVTLRSSNPAAAAVPASVRIDAGTTSAPFVITTSSVRLNTNVTISATLTGVTKTVTLQLTASVQCFGVTCAPPTQCQAAVSCNVISRRCSYTLPPVGTPCDDGNPNTVGDACNDNACIGVDRCAGVTCPTTPCRSSVCDHATGTCTNTALPNGTTCDDANPNTTGDICTSGTCAGTDRCIGVVCPGDACHMASCDHATGTCSSTNLPNGTPCDDGNPSTTGDVCAAGSCTGIDHCIGVTCPSDGCRVGSCDHATGVCSSTDLPNGTPCDDGNPSTTGDVCAAGSCMGTSVSCPEINLALNAASSGFPNPTQSDPGWGGGSNPWDIVDGAPAYDTWSRGLAFTGGHQTASGGPPYIEPAGVRHAVIDFGSPQTFHKLVLWWHGAEHTPDSGSIEVWDGSQWGPIGSIQRQYGAQHAAGSNSGYSDSDSYTFAPVSGSKVRYTFDNGGLNILGTYNIHGWLYEFEAFGCASGHRVTSITAGFAHSCALFADGTAKCWGHNYNGQLGSGTTTTGSVPVPYGIADPVPVVNLSTARALAAGGLHTCALLANGTVTCWGANASGQLGDGSTTESASPVTVSSLTGVSAIAAGARHTCALLSGGTVACWGMNVYGELGDGTNTDSPIPVPVSGLANVTALALGDSHSCARLANTTVRCWGSNARGQLGNGALVHANTPVSVSGLSGVSSIHGASFHTCVLLATGGGRCWGSNSYGQVGVGDRTGEFATPTNIASLSGIKALGAGGDETCALLGDTTLACWGNNNAGQLGNGTITGPDVCTNGSGCGLLPGAVSNLTGVTSVEVGSLHACALLQNGTVECWGFGPNGQLGDGAAASSSLPVVVSGL